MVDRSWGLLALARSGQVDLELDESNDGAQAAYMLTLRLPSVELRCAVAGLAAIKSLGTFMRANHGQTTFAELQIGELDGLVVRLIKDDEHVDRFFIRAGNAGMIDVTIIDPDASDLARAADELAAKT